MSILSRIRYCSIFAKENRVLQIVLPLCVIASLVFGFNLWSIRMPPIPYCEHELHTNPDSIALKRAFYHSQKTVDSIIAMAVEEIAQNKRRQKESTISHNHANSEALIPVGYHTSASCTSSGVDFSSLTGDGPRKPKRVKRPNARMTNDMPNRVKGLCCARNQTEIAITVTENLGSLQVLYQKHRKNNPTLSGKLKVTFAIDEYGNILHNKLLESTMDNSHFHKEVLQTIKSWKFDTVACKGAITEVTYPFTFTK